MRPTVPLLGVMIVVATVSAAYGQPSAARPSENVEDVTSEATVTPESPTFTLDRPIYRALQDWKKQLNEKYGINWALEDTAIYQATSGGGDANDAMVNTLGLFATWKIFRSEDGKEFAGFGFQAETRGNPTDDHFTDMTADLGTIWSPNDSTSNDYSKINQLWWGQRLAAGKIGYSLGKIDPGAYINGNRFAGSGNTQFFSQPFATNPARSFPDNGIGLNVRVDPIDWLYAHFLMSDSDAVSTYSPFKTVDGRWFYAGEVGLKPKLAGLGEGVYRAMLYHRDTEAADEFGWSLSADQNFTADYGVFVRYNGNEGRINAIQQLLAVGFSFLNPFGRDNDEAGIGVSFTHPSADDLRDEYSTEFYYRWQVSEGLQISGSAQLILNPSASANDAVGVLGVRARLLY